MDSLKERSFAFGIFNTGSAVGAVIALPCSQPFQKWATGVGLLHHRRVHFVWVVVWWILYDRPSRSRFVTAA
jgi:ACS family hexuronate transporter-like MFS transporter